MKGNTTTCALLVSAALYGAIGVTQAQPLPVTDNQRSTARQVAQQGVPLSALNPNAPESYTVQAGDTLWRISGLFLRQPWRWPELWGMNLQTIANPHLIYPGQTLYLDKSNGYARLSDSRSGGTPTVKLSPQVRSQSLSSTALPTLQMHIIEAFMSEPLVASSDSVANAPRIIAGDDDRMLRSPGDRAYVRGPKDVPLLREAETPSSYRVFRQAVPLHDPSTKEILGYEAQYLGRAQLERGETPVPAPQSDNTASHLPAAIIITQAKEELMPGDRLLPEPPRQYLNFVPHAPQSEVNAQVASIYGNASVHYGTQYQIVAINKGLQDGITPGMVLSLMTKGKKIQDKTNAQRENVQLPDEENGLAMVFRSFDRVSYALIMDIQRGVQVGDRLAQPR